MSLTAIIAVDTFLARAVKYNVCTLNHSNMIQSNDCLHGGRLIKTTSKCLKHTSCPLTKKGQTIRKWRRIYCKTFKFINVIKYGFSYFWLNLWLQVALATLLSKLTAFFVGFLLNIKFWVHKVVRIYQIWALSCSLASSWIDHLSQHT